MTSQRFPGKTTALLDGKPVITRIVERCLSVPVGKIIVAIPWETESQAIIDELNASFDDERLDIFTGAKEDVLDRYYQCATMHKLKTIVRVTGDCPLVDPKIIIDVIKLYFKNKLDYCSNVYPDRTFAKGLDCEVFSYDCLEAAWLTAQSTYDREHVTPWMQNEDEVRKGLLKSSIDTSSGNLCVDVPADIKRLEDIIVKERRKTFRNRQLH